MAEFEPLQGGGGSGGHSTRTPKPNKKLLLYGGLAVGAIVVVQALFKRPAAQTDAPLTVDTGTPTNSADYQAAMQNNQDILQGYVDQSLTSFYNQMNADQASTQKEYQDQLQAQNDKLSAIQQTVDHLQPVPTSATTKPTSTPSTAPKPTTATTKKSTPVVSAAQNLINKIDGKNTKTNSIVDYLKSANVGSSMADRKKIAATLGIKNYTGTAAQNTAMLKKLKSDGK